MHRFGIRTKLKSLKKYLPIPPLALSSPEGGIVPFPALDAGERALLRRVSRKIHPADNMLHFGLGHYFGVGLSASRAIRRAVTAAGLKPQRVLDFPCGYGRVLRFLKAAYPDAQFTASDLERDGVDFCARGLSATGIHSSVNLDEVNLGEPFDLIWVGSLLTHFDEKKIAEAMQFFRKNLRAGGLLVFTAHGSGPVYRMRHKTLGYGLSAEDEARLLDGYEASGYGFAEYEAGSGYGISLTSPAWIRRLMSEARWREVYFEDQAWDNHQDVFGFVPE
ncbi:MAG: class I SAM-dependent methyltransferase [Pyrinomonadaceae bacterium]